MKHLKYLKIICVMLSSMLVGCNEELDRRTTLTFVGDSIVARWDLQNFFSSLATSNEGRSGAGIAYVETLAGTCKGKNVVVMIGTNDNMDMVAEKREQYAERYIKAINALQADKVYLYEVLPRDFNHDRATVNDDIKAFNEIVRRRVADFPDIVYLEVYDRFLRTQGRIQEEYYNDRLHLSSQGYEILANILFRNL